MIAQMPAVGFGAVVGEDILAALCSAGLCGVAAVPVTGLPGTSAATFRITLADGNLVKVRRCTRPERLRRAAALLQALNHDQLPAVRFLAGRIAIEDWIVGTPLGERALSPGHLDRAAALLADLHTTPSLAGQALLKSRTTRPLRQQAELHLARLEAAAALTPKQCRNLSALLHRHDPGRAVVGLTHNDFCGENLVERDGGKLYAIDNEGLRLGFLEFDLARTWYRWSLPDEAWQRFLSGYSTRCAEPIAANAPFWRITAVVKSAFVRVIRRKTALADVPLRILRALAADHA